MKNVTATVVLLSVVLLGVYGERPGVKAEAGGPRLEAATEMEEHPLKAISRDAAEKMLRWVLFKINLKNKEMESPLKKMVMKWIKRNYVINNHENDDIGEEDELDLIEEQQGKRQFDDYGHMRFGKREFEDYGHMRFGR